MKSRRIATRGAVMLALAGCLLGPSALQAQTMDQYYAVPPFVNDQVAPNIVLLLDNSGSMSDRACDPTSCGTPDPMLPSVPVTENFVATSSYSGFFNSLACYTYDAANTRFDSAAVKAVLSTICVGTQWDGNFLNWAGFRRFDALKRAMSGGDCVATRAADGTCPPSGATAKITNMSQELFLNSGDGHKTTNAIPSGGANGYGGRVPTAATPGGPNPIYIHLRGGVDGMAGSICVDNDPTDPLTNATSCLDGADAFPESNYKLRFTSAVDQTGVVQQIGAQARFGLFEFKGSGDGARMLVGLGSRQAINFSDSTVETFNTNVAAILDALRESSPSTWTPLSESLYETARYIAQINSTFDSSNYVYPIAYSGGISSGVAFGATGVGSIGAPEISALTGIETCTAGAGYITNACGRDPYFFGSNHTPPWATTSSQVRCCKTFVIIVTDGEPTQDTNIPAGIQDYAHGHHGVHCTGADVSSPTAPINAICNAHPNTTAPYLIGTSPTTTAFSGEHKVGGAGGYTNNGNHYLDDVAYWAHTNDLRPCTAAGADDTIAVLGVTGHCLQGLQNITVYTFFAFGNIAGREILMHTAQLGGFEDSNNNNIPDLVTEWDKVVNATGAPGTDGIPDNYFESSNADDLQDRLMAAITAILRKSSSGTAISVLQRR